MARFLFIWMIMIGAMVGMREGAHFEVDLWPELAPRAEAAVRLVAKLCVLVMALVFVWCRHRVHAFRLEPHLRAGGAAAVDDSRRLAADRLYVACVSG